VVGWVNHDVELDDVGLPEPFPLQVDVKAKGMLLPTPPDACPNIVEFGLVSPHLGDLDSADGRNLLGAFEDIPSGFRCDAPTWSPSVCKSW
jgi:hypothetical protein